VAPPELSVLLAGLLICFVAGVLGGLSGAGTGLIVAGFLAPVVGAKAVMPALAVIMLINNGSRVFYYRQAVDWRIAALMTALALPGTYAGAQLYMHLSVPTLEFILGTAILLVLGYRLIRRRLARQTSGQTASASTAPPLWKKVLGGPIALLYGFINSLVPGSGVMVLAYFSAIGMSAAAVIANDALLSAVLNLVKVFLFRQLDGLPNDLMLLALLCGLASIPGVWLAKWLSTRLRHGLQQGLIEMVIAASALHLLIRAVRDQVLPNLATGAL
jgi:uncharacterized membrane protein YfcA